MIGSKSSGRSTRVRGGCELPTFWIGDEGGGDGSGGDGRGALDESVAVGASGEVVGGEREEEGGGGEDEGGEEREAHAVELE